MGEFAVLFSKKSGSTHLCQVFQKTICPDLGPTALIHFVAVCQFHFVFDVAVVTVGKYAYERLL